MSDCYRPLIEGMRWSYSRIKAYEDCRYRFFLKYIEGCSDKDQFYASYGSFMHKLLERFYLGLLTKDEMLNEFLMCFSDEVKGQRPSEKIISSYISDGISYLKSFEPLPYKTLAVEEKIELDIDGIPFVAILDYVGEKDGKLYIVDNKSRKLKPRSGRKKPTQSDNELDDMLRQLYIYSAAVKQKFGRLPDYLCFNCFRNGNLIVEKFDESKYEEAIEWVKETVRKIEDTDNFYPHREFFSCKYICGVCDECCYNEMEYD